MSQEPGAPVALRSQTSERSQFNEAPGNLDALIRRVADTSMDEIDGVIRELEQVREILRNEGERVSREIASYASFSQSAVTAMKIVSDALTAWKDRSS